MDVSFVSESDIYMISVTMVEHIDMRVLISLDEASRIIGSQGAVISRIRGNNEVKIGISKAVVGCSDRILTCSGGVSNVANALGDVVDMLLTSYNDDEEEVGDEAETEIEDDGVSAMQKKKFPFPFLNHILPPPSLNEIKDPTELKNIGYIRLIILNNQLSSIIGKGGNKIKSLIEKHGVKIVASKDFLPDSNERILEIQGFPGSISNTLKDMGSIVLNETEPSAVYQKRYYPHLKRPSSSHEHDETQEEVKSTVLVPEIYVGAMLGREGNRLNSLRKYTKTRIVAAKASERPDEKFYFFTITGHSAKNVLMAESMLVKNLETEMERHNDSLEKKIEEAR